MTRRLIPRFVAVGLLVVAMGAVNVVTGRSPVAAASGGRVTVNLPIRIRDTRSGVPLPAGQIAPLGGGVLTVLVSGVDLAGTGMIASCADANVVVAHVAFAAGGWASTTVTSSEPLCLSATVAVNYILDRSGLVASSATPGGSQYVPLSAPVVGLRSGPVESPPLGPIKIALSLQPPQPIGTTGTVFLVEVSEANGAPSGFSSVAVSSCSSSPLSIHVFFAGARVSALAIVPASVGGYCIYMYGAANVTVTAIGVLSTEGPDPNRLPPALDTVASQVPRPGLRPLTPTRVLDTRIGLGARLGKLPAGGQISVSELPLTPTSTAAVLNVTVTEPDDAGFITVWPCDVTRPVVSNLNFVLGETSPNQVTVAIGTSRKICLFASASAHLIADIAGTYELDGGVGIRPINPNRILDTRVGLGANAEPLIAAHVLTLRVSGRGGAPDIDVRAATMNVTVTEPTGAGFLTVWPCDRPQPTASNLNFVAGETIPNLVTSKLSATGTVCFVSNSTLHVIADIAAVYLPEDVVGFAEVTPNRILDTRTGLGVPTPGKLAAFGVLHLHVAGQGGVPPVGALAVTMNVTATEPVGVGYVTVWPCDQAMPTVSNLNVTAAATTPNLVSVRLASDGTVCMFTTAGTHLIADIAGYATLDRIFGWARVAA